MTLIPDIASFSWAEKFLKLKFLLIRVLYLNMTVSDIDLLWYPEYFLSKSNIHDREKFEDLVYSIDGKIHEISADGAYDDRGCYEAIKNVGAQPLIPPGANTIFWEQGHPRNNAVMQLKTFKSNDNWKK